MGVTRLLPIIFRNAKSEMHDESLCSADNVGNLMLLIVQLSSLLLLMMLAGIAEPVDDS